MCHHRRTYDIAQLPEDATDMASLLFLNGPNLNLLGSREPHLYGSDTLAEVEARVTARGNARGVALACFQSNHEGELIDRIHAARTDGTRFIVINPGGLAHTSVSLRDALAGVAIPFVEIHVSNVYRREPFRHHSYLSALAVGTIAGFGAAGYLMAVDAAIDQIDRIDRIDEIERSA